MSVIMAQFGDSREVENMDQGHVECSELSGKVIKTARIYKSDNDGTEIQIDLTDGTSFSCCVSHPPVVTASVFQRGVGEPEILRKYEL